MSEKSPTYDSVAVRFSGAVALGMMLTFGNRDIPDPTFALIADANWLRDSGFIVGQRLLLFLLLIFCGIHRSLFLVGALITLTTWIMMYSMVGAFSVALITMALYGYFVLHRPADDRKSVAAIIVSLTFVLAAIQKLNPSYLRGDEFTSLGAFFGFLEYWDLAPYELPEFLRLKVLPIASILVEFAIGFGVLFKPALFSHLALLFTTLL